MSDAEEIALPDDGGLAALLSAPFVPGDGPFHIKGNAYRGHMRYLETEVPGGVEAHSAALLELGGDRGDALVRFFEQKFLAGAWYDAYPLAIAGAACARVTDEEFMSFVHRRTCWQARDDIGGIYRFLLKFVSARAIAKRVPGLVTRYLDFVDTEVEVVDDYTLRSTLTGAPTALMPWLSTVVEAYLTTVIEIAGNETPEILPLPTWGTGEAHGVPVCTAARIVRLANAPPSLGTSRPPSSRAPGSDLR